ncbi:hypothetical protein EYF80_068344 [Liparis tanakae]
MSPTV